MDEYIQRFNKYLDLLKSNPTMVDDMIGESPGEKLIKFVKDPKLAEIGRKEGNRLFLQDNHDVAVLFKILHCYNQAVAFAKNDSEELALAYESRSALLRCIRKYAESVIEIDKALKITSCARMKVELLCRKAECLTALGSTENKSCLEAARFILSKSSESAKVKKKIKKIIIQTRTKVDADQLDKPKENCNEVESFKIIAEAEKIDIQSRVKIEFNEKYGRHLVAARDFEPGEVIFVEKPYVNDLHRSKFLKFCSYCFNYLWTAYPCNHCSYVLFCSEECKSKALNEYHDIECPVIAQMADSLLLKVNCIVPIVVKVFIRALKESGSLSQLQENLKSIDRCQGERKKGFSPNDDCKDFYNIYTRRIRRIDESQLDYYLERSFLALFGFAKYSSIFKRNYALKEIDKLKNDESAVFVGALLFKLSLLIKCRNTSVVLDDPDEKNVDQNPRGDMIARAEDNVSFKSIGFLSVFGCITNACSVYTHGNRFATYALTPIEKGSPLITPSRSIFNLASKADRQALHQEVYNCPCHCLACVEDWSEKFTNVSTHVAYYVENFVAPEITRPIKRVSEEISAKLGKPNFPDLKLLSEAKEHVAEAWEEFSMPSITTLKAVQNLMQLLVYFHAPRLDLHSIRSCKT